MAGGSKKEIKPEVLEMLKRKWAEQETWVEGNALATLQKQEDYLVKNYSGFKAVFDDCCSQLGKARLLVHDTDPKKQLDAQNILLKVEARIRAAISSDFFVDLWWRKIFMHNFALALVALCLGAFAIFVPLSAGAGYENSTQNVAAGLTPQAIGQKVDAVSGSGSSQNAGDKGALASFAGVLLLGLAAGMLGGTMVAIYELIDHAMQGDFSYEHYYWSFTKWIKGGLSGLVAVLPFIAGLAIFKVDTSQQIQVTVATFAIIAFLVGFNEKYFLELLKSVGRTVFKPADASGGGNGSTG